MSTYASSKIMCLFSQILLELGRFLLESGMPYKSTRGPSTEVSAELLVKHCI